MLREYLDNFISTYVNNIISFSDNLEEYRKHVRLVLKKL